MTDTLHAEHISEADIAGMVSLFYERIRQDKDLGPIFEANVHDWDEHLVVLTDFWSALILGTRRFKGAPIPKHAALPDLSWPLFERWLAIFRTTTHDIGNPHLQHKANMMAERIAAKLWQVYKEQTVMTLPDTLPPGLECYSQSPVFTPETLPEKLKATHTTKAGTYGLLRVISGIVRFTVENSQTDYIVTSGKQLVIEPEVPHHVQFELNGSFQIDFYRSKDHVKRD